MNHVDIRLMGLQEQKQSLCVCVCESSFSFVPFAAGSWAVCPNTVLYVDSPGLLFFQPSVAVAVMSCRDDFNHTCYIEELVCLFVTKLSCPPVLSHR